MPGPASGAAVRLYQSRTEEPGLEVNARAAIGHHQQLLLLRALDTTDWFLPGTPVVFGEPAEDGLRRALREILDAPVTSILFLVAIEHFFTDRLGTAHHVLDLVFDVSLANHRVQCSAENLELRWLTLQHLDDITLTPPGLPEGLRSGRFDHGDRWLPWRRQSSI